MRLRRHRKRQGLGGLVEAGLHRILVATWVARRLVRTWRLAR